MVAIRNHFTEQLMHEWHNHSPIHPLLETVLSEDPIVQNQTQRNLDVLGQTKRLREVPFSLTHVLPYHRDQVGKCFGTRVIELLEFIDFLPVVACGKDHLIWRMGLFLLNDRRNCWSLLGHSRFRFVSGLTVKHARNQEESPYHGRLRKFS